MTSTGSIGQRQATGTDPPLARHAARKGVPRPASAGTRSRVWGTPLPPRLCADLSAEGVEQPSPTDVSDTDARMHRRRCTCAHRDARTRTLCTRTCSHRLGIQEAKHLVSSETSPFVKRRSAGSVGQVPPIEHARPIWVHREPGYAGGLPQAAAR